MSTSTAHSAATFMTAPQASNAVLWVTQDHKPAEVNDQANSLELSLRRSGRLPHATGGAHIPCRISRSPAKGPCLEFRPPQQPDTAQRMVQQCTDAPEPAKCPREYFQASNGLIEASSWQSAHDLCSSTLQPYNSQLKPPATCSRIIVAGTLACMLG